MRIVTRPVYRTDTAVALAALFGAQRIGISTDTVAKQKEFSDKHSFDYPLLSDADGTVSRAFGVKRPIDLLRVKRATFVIGTDQVIIEAIASELNMNTHADKALAALGG